MAGCFLFFVFSTSVWEGAATITPLSPLLTSSKMIKSSSASGSQSNLRVCTQKHLCTTLTLLAHFTLDSEFRQSTLFASHRPFSHQSTLFASLFGGLKNCEKGRWTVMFLLWFYTALWLAQSRWSPQQANFSILVTDKRLLEFQTKLLPCKRVWSILC